MYQSWVEVSRSALRKNLLCFQKLVGKDVVLMPIIKSNAYGHGMLEVAQILKNDVEWFGVVTTGEALALRARGIRKRLFCLSYADTGTLTTAIDQRIDLPVYNKESAKQIEQAARRSKFSARVHIKIDTGMTRIGILPSDAAMLLQFVKRLRNVQLVGLYSHFASSEDDQTFTKLQLARFTAIRQHPLCRDIPYIHFACTAAVISQPTSHYNMARLGIGLYGLWPSEKLRQVARRRHPWLKLDPALTWKTKIIQVKAIPKGTRVGYGGTFKARQAMRIAVIAIGYWEGYDCGLSNSGIVNIRGINCPVIGRVCMNIMMVDVTRVSSVKVGDEVELLGPHISADSIAKKLNTINYEIVTRINPVLPRILTA